MKEIENLLYNFLIVFIILKNFTLIILKEEKTQLLSMYKSLNIGTFASGIFFTFLILSTVENNEIPKLVAAFVSLGR